MGIDAQTFSNKFPKKTFGFAKGNAALKLVDKYAKEWASAKGLERFYSSSMSAETGLTIEILPIAGAIFIELTDQGLSVGFRTSNGGPGYHAAIIDLLDYLASTLKIEWNWGHIGDDCLDETGYAIARDFGSLQNQMSEFFVTLMKLIQRQNMNKGSVCLPMGLGQSGNNLSCPQGIFSMEYPLLIIDANPAELADYAKSFFLWWEKGIDNQFWSNLLRGLLWQNAQFRPLLNKDERKTYEQIKNIQNLLEQRQFEIPDDLKLALSELDIAIETDQYEDKSGIGYLKQFVEHVPFSNWQIELPGRMAICDTGEDTAITYFDGQKTLRISSITASKENPDTHFDWSKVGDVVQGSQIFSHNNLDWRLSKPNEEDGQITQFAIVLHSGEEEHQLLMLTLTIGSSNNLSVFDDWIRLIRYSE